MAIFKLVSISARKYLMTERFRAYKASILGTRHEEGYRVRSAIERLRLIRELGRKAEPITVHLGDDASNGEIYFVTTILDADKDRNTFVFERAQSEEQNQIMASRNEIKCAARLDRVPLEFVISNPVNCSHQGIDAFMARIPERMIRVQRREFFRLVIPSNTLASCRARITSPDTPPLELSLEITDISIGGIGCDLPYIPDMMLEVGAVLKECKLFIPDIQPVTLDLEIKNIFQRTTGNGKTQHIGLSFMNRPEQFANQIQRYIYQAERELMREK